ncbi:MAG TPA: hypothetical protein V6C81_29405 [Planktothrix sp.]|jgi:hypothetical protein
MVEMIDDFDWPRSSVAPEPAATTPEPSGASAQPAPEPPAPEPAPVVVLTEADIRKSVRAKMAAVLAAHPKLLLAQAASSEAKGVAHTANELLNEVKLPINGDDTTVGNFVAEFQQRHASFMQAKAKEVEPAINLADAEAAWSIAHSELEAALIEYGSRLDVIQQEYFIAARHLFSLSLSVKISGATAPEVLADDFVFPPADRALVVALRTKTFAFAKVLGEITVAAPVVVKAVADYWSNYWLTVNPPTRPTEEEIQRYLMQLEKVFSDKLSIHRRVAKALGCDKMIITRVENSHKTVTAIAAPGTREDLLVRLDKLYSELNEALVAVERLSYHRLHGETSCAHQCARKVQAAYSAVRDSMGDGLKNRESDNLDRVEIAKARPREVRQIGEVRKLMRLVAIAKAKHNEAKAALAATESSSVLSVNWVGVVKAKSLNEMVSWHSAKTEEGVRAVQKNTSRQAKIDLLKEQVDHFEKDVENNIVSLERYLETIKPPESDPACDEKRIIHRAGWLACQRPPSPRDDD